MAEHDDSAEKTEEPTGKRLEDARKKGQVLRSRELGTLVSLLGCGLALLLLGPSLIAACERMLGAAFVLDASVLRDASVLPQRLRQAGIDMLVAGLPLLGCVVALALLGPALLGGWICNGELLQPKLERLDPLRGLGRLFSLKSLVELVKALAKFGVVAALAIAVLALVLPDIVKLSLLEARVALERSGRLFLLCYLGFSAALILVVLFDVPYQIHDYRRQLRMTKQELKDELKESEGRPEVKAALRARQQEAASRRMMAQVPKADVVITNPTHYAVALRYEQGGARAPTLIAKGRGEIAARIRELAGEHKVPLFSAPPLARALYVSTPLDREIPANLFVAVAQVLAYIYQLRAAAAGLRKQPSPPDALPVPPEYDQTLAQSLGQGDS